MAEKTEATQMNFPGINRKKELYEGLLRENPTPTTEREAEAFFRKHTDALLKLKEDHDFIRVVLKGTDTEEEKEKHEYTATLDLFNREKRARAFIDLAQKVHALWLDMEEPKHREK